MIQAIQVLRFHLLELEKVGVKIVPGMDYTGKQWWRSECWQTWICLRRCTTCATTSVIATSPVWRVKCPQTSSWTSGRAAPSLTWRTSLDPVPVCLSRWDDATNLAQWESPPSLRIFSFPAASSGYLNNDHLPQGFLFRSTVLPPTSSVCACRMHRGYGSLRNVPLLLWERPALVACLHSAQQTTVATQVSPHTHTQKLLQMWFKKMHVWT